jgi:excisionase family DNA binding protein
MAARKRSKPLSDDELRRVFDGVSGVAFGPILSPKQLADLCGLSPKTIYEWIAKGRLKDASRKRGKHVLIWRDRVLNLLLFGPEWNDAPKE